MSAPVQRFGVLRPQDKRADPGGADSAAFILGPKKQEVELSVSGVAVSMVAFQAIDPGSTPGSRKYFSVRLPRSELEKK